MVLLLHCRNAAGRVPRILALLPTSGSPFMSRSPSPSLPPPSPCLRLPSAPSLLSPCLLSTRRLVFSPAPVLARPSFCRSLPYTFEELPVSPSHFSRIVEIEKRYADPFVRVCLHGEMQTVFSSTVRCWRLRNFRLYHGSGEVLFVVCHAGGILDLE
jgi:hypothetical protein